MTYNDHPEYDAEGHLLGFMAKVSLAEQRTRPSFQERHQMQSTLGYSTIALDGFPLIQPVGQETNQTHHGNDDPVSDGGDNHDLLFAFRSLRPVESGYAEPSTLVLQMRLFCPVFVGVLVVLTQKLCQNEVLKFLANE
jgi:hypothetical protein